MLLIGYVPKAKSLLLMLIVFIMLSLISVSYAALTVPGADGADGVLNITQDTTIDLGLAVTGNWDAIPHPGPGKGIYDPAKWAVVFRYDSVTIAAGKTLKFINHPANPPVVWIVKNDVTIDGTVNLSANDNGYNNSATEPSLPGPGGFRAGKYSRYPEPSSAGYGPGGASASITLNRGGAGGSYGTQGKLPTQYIGESIPGIIYGNSSIIPLIGGSGGSGANWENPGNSYGGGAGGGAILICVQGKIYFSGKIVANGGAAYEFAGEGSGGSIKLITDIISGNGIMLAEGGRLIGGGSGRIRIEANQNTLSNQGNPIASCAIPANPPKIWLEDTDPQITLKTLDGKPIPADPHAQMTVSDSDLNITTEGTKELIIEAKNVPISWTMSVRCVPYQGADQNLTATFESGDVILSTWKAQIDAKAGLSNIQARAYNPNAYLK